MASCWLCGKTVKPNTRIIDCQQCHGCIATPDDETRRHFEVKRMMGHDAYKRRGGKLKQTRFRDSD